MAKRTKKKDDDQQSPPPRQFMKHAQTGEIVAIEWLDDRHEGPSGARRCSKPEEQTRGALPVLVLDDDDQTLGWIEDNRPHLEPWDPPVVDDDDMPF